MATQEHLPGMELMKSERQPTPMDLLQIALTNNAAIDVIERLSALQTQAMKHSAELAFNEAMNAAQSEIGRIAPDLTNKQTGSAYASYQSLDRVLRPVYVRHGFSLSFDTDPLDPSIEMVRVVCHVAHRDGHSRKYQIDMPADGKGAKGGDVMTKTHARGSASSYGMRYLLKMIFNVAIGEDDDDGNLTTGWLAERIEWLDNCRNLDELHKVYAAAFKEASADKNYKALAALTEKRDARKKAISGGY